MGAVGGPGPPGENTTTIGQPGAAGVVANRTLYLATVLGLGQANTPFYFISSGATSLVAVDNPAPVTVVNTPCVASNLVGRNALAGDLRTYTLQVNGISTSLTCTTDGVSDCNSASASIPLAVGDLINFITVGTAGGTARPKAGWVCSPV